MTGYHPPGHSLRNRDDRCRSTRRGDIGRNTLIALVVAIAATMAAGYWIYQLTRQEQFARDVATARTQLQVDRNDEALATLHDSDSSSAPAEYHYLRAIALDRLKRAEPALAEIRRAIAIEANNPKYRALELRFRLFAREKSAADQLIELNRDFASVGAVALFSTYGFQAKAFLLEDERKPKAAEFHHDRRRQTLETALTLSAEIPELTPELILFARNNDRHIHALRLVDEQLAIEPDSIPLRTERIRVLVSMKQFDEAVQIAKTLHEESGRQEQGAQFYASVLAQASGTPEHDATFLELVDTFPRNGVVIAKYAVYLTRTGRLLAAQKKIADVMGKQENAEDRESLAFVSITLPLEVNAPELAERQLREYRVHLRDELLVDYFEARILYLKKQYTESVDRMLKIANASRTGQGGSRALAEEALNWVRHILADEILTTRMKAIADSAETVRRDRVTIQLEGSPSGHSSKPPSGDPGAPSPQPSESSVAVPGTISPGSLAPSAVAPVTRKPDSLTPSVGKPDANVPGPASGPESTVGTAAPESAAPSAAITPAEIPPTAQTSADGGKAPASDLPVGRSQP